MGPHLSSKRRPYSVPLLPQTSLSVSKKKRVSSLITSCGSIFSRRHGRNLSSSPFSISIAPTFPPITPLWANNIPPRSTFPPQLGLTPDPRRPLRPPVGTRRMVSVEQKRDVLVKMIAKGTHLPDCTLMGIRHILSKIYPYVYVARTSLYIDVDDLPMNTVDELYAWIVGHQI